MSLALDVYGIYTGSCNRELGSIIDVRDQYFDILTIEGEIKTLPRYQAIYITTYPLDVLPIEKLTIPKGTKTHQIFSLDSDKIVPYLKGWPINFTTDQVSFLTTSGREVLMDKTSIWKIKALNQNKTTSKSKNSKLSLNFLDPYPFSHCKRQKGKNKIIPQKLYADAVDVKREFDRLQEGHSELQVFKRRQRFYPKPEIYSNISKLGLWLMTGARYGASESRPNNFSPFLQNELSLGAYSYQHMITTGAGPVLYGTHTESQTHFYYRMKAEYVHVSLMADPNTLLVGKQYKWKANDLSPVDFRANESFFIEFGFDYGPFSLEFSPAMKMHTGTRLGNYFYEADDLNLPRFGLRYTNIKSTINLILGTGKEDSITYQDNYDASGNYIDSTIKHYQMKMSLWRLNYERKVFNKDQIALSFVHKTSDGVLDSNTYEFSSTALSGIYTYKYKRRYFFSGLIGLESYKTSGRVGAQNFSDSDLKFKIGANASLQF